MSQPNRRQRRQMEKLRRSKEQPEERGTDTPRWLGGPESLIRGILWTSQPNATEELLRRLEQPGSFVEPPEPFAPTPNLGKPVVVQPPTPKGELEEAIDDFRARQMAEAPQAEPVALHVNGVIVPELSEAYFDAISDQHPVDDAPPAEPVEIRFGIVMRGFELTPSGEPGQPDSGEPGAFSVMADSRFVLPSGATACPPPPARELTPQERHDQGWAGFGRRPFEGEVYGFSLSSDFAPRTWRGVALRADGSSGFLSFPAEPVAAGGASGGASSEDRTISVMAQVDRIEQEADAQAARELRDLLLEGAPELVVLAFQRLRLERTRSGVLRAAEEAEDDPERLELLLDHSEDLGRQARAVEERLQELRAAAAAPAPQEAPASPQEPSSDDAKAKLLLDAFQAVRTLASPAIVAVSQAIKNA